MYLLTTFKQQTKTKEPTTKQLRNKALLSGVLAVPGLAVASNDLNRGIKLIKDTNNLDSNLAKNKTALIANHPDKLIGKDDSVIKAATDKFKQLSAEKDKLIKLKDTKKELDKVKGIGKVKKAIGMNIREDALKNLKKVKDPFIRMFPEDFVKDVKMGKKISYGLTGLGAISAGVAAAKYINRKRKEREDKGRKRGSYK